MTSTLTKNSKIIKIVAILSLSLTLFSPLLAKAAYSGSYSFEIANSISGGSHELASLATKTTAKGNTYTSAGNVQTAKSTFNVHLDRLLHSYVSGDIAADGVSHTKSFGTVSSGTYKVSVYKSSSTGALVKGSGKIIQ